jgi:LysR family nitrogen assimilation transcriptional regulator
LLQRGPRGVRLTRDGAILYESARRILTESARVRQQLGGDRAPAGGAVTLGVSPTLTRVLLPGVFERCYHNLSGVGLTVREAFTPQLMEGLERGLVDMAVVTNPEPHHALALQPLLAEPFALITPAERGMAPVISLPELARIPVLMTSLHLGIVQRTLEPLSARLNVAAVLDSVDAIRELVMQGRWATIMPVSVFKDSFGGPARLSEISGAQLNRMLVLATRIERARSPSVAVMADLVRAEATALAGRGMFNFGGGR